MPIFVYLFIIFNKNAADVFCGDYQLNLIGSPFIWGYLDFVIFL